MTKRDWQRLNAAEGRLLTWFANNRTHKMAIKVWYKAQELSDLYHEHMTMTKKEYYG